MSTEGVNLKSTENIKLQVLRKLSHESASGSIDDIEETASRIEDGIERDGAIADQISQLSRQGSDSIMDHDDDVLINKGNILFVKPFCLICIM